MNKNLIIPSAFSQGQMQQVPPSPGYFINERDKRILKDKLDLVSDLISKTSPKDASNSITRQLLLQEYNRIQSELISGPKSYIESQQKFKHRVEVASLPFSSPAPFTLLELNERKTDPTIPNPPDCIHYDRECTGRVNPTTWVRPANPSWKSHRDAYSEPNRSMWDALMYEEKDPFKPEKQYTEPAYSPMKQSFDHQMSRLSDFSISSRLKSSKKKRIKRESNERKSNREERRTSLSNYSRQSIEPSFVSQGQQPRQQNPNFPNFPQPGQQPIIIQMPPYPIMPQPIYAAPPVYTPPPQQSQPAQVTINVNHDYAQQLQKSPKHTLETSIQCNESILNSPPAEINPIIEEIIDPPEELNKEEASVEATSQNEEEKKSEETIILDPWATQIGGSRKKLYELFLERKADLAHKMEIRDKGMHNFLHKSVKINELMKVRQDMVKGKTSVDEYLQSPNHQAKLTPRQTELALPRKIEKEERSIQIKQKNMQIKKK
ncbi:unnamed protein product [Blepharisma stoltei]|uniref:Uncharacterized protein n=1 Tax=Blepharisma stoltei TaxID=1481888 RepID=A0AAU9KBI9_9CILI|nr:unnamed protein product [Blepharisma stoltei]